MEIEPSHRAVVRSYAFNRQEWKDALEYDNPFVVQLDLQGRYYLWDRSLGVALDRRGTEREIKKLRMSLL